MPEAIALHGLEALMRATSMLMFSIGLGLVAIALLLGAGASVPYHDAPPELLALQAEEVREAILLLVLGLVGMVFGGIGLWRTRSLDRAGRSPITPFRSHHER